MSIILLVAGCNSRAKQDSNTKLEMHNEMEPYYGC